MDRHTLSPTILVVDSDGGTRALLRFYLERDGFRITEAGTADDALAVVDEQKDIHLALLDQQLPPTEGMHLLQHLRQRPGWERRPIVLLLPRANSDDPERFIAAGASACVLKPFRPQHLVTEIRRLLSAAPAAAGESSDVAARTAGESSDTAVRAAGESSETSARAPVRDSSIEAAPFAVNDTTTGAGLSAVNESTGGLARSVFNDSTGGVVPSVLNDFSNAASAADIGSSVDDGASAGVETPMDDAVEDQPVEPGILPGRSAVEERMREPEEETQPAYTYDSAIHNPALDQSGEFPSAANALAADEEPAQAHDAATVAAVDENPVGRAGLADGENPVSHEDYSSEKISRGYEDHVENGNDFEKDDFRPALSGDQISDSGSPERPGVRSLETAVDTLLSAANAEKSLFDRLAAELANAETVKVQGTWAVDSPVEVNVGSFIRPSSVDITLRPDEYQSRTFDTAVSPDSTAAAEHDAAGHDTAEQDAAAGRDSAGMDLEGAAFKASNPEPPDLGTESGMETSANGDREDRSMNTITGMPAVSSAPGAPGFTLVESAADISSEMTVYPKNDAEAAQLVPDTSSQTAYAERPREESFNQGLSEDEITRKEAGPTVFAGNGSGGQAAAEVAAPEAPNELESITPEVESQDEVASQDVGAQEDVEAEPIEAPAAAHVIVGDGVNLSRHPDR